MLRQLLRPTLTVLKRAESVSSAKIQSRLLCSTSFDNLTVVNIQDEADFSSSVLKSNIPVVIDFHATWCGPCKLLAPRLESVMAAVGNPIILAKVDIDKLAELAMEYKVEAVPTVLGMKNGKVLDKFTGTVDEDRIESFVKELTAE